MSRSSLLLALLALSCARSGFRKATDVDEAAENCAVLQDLSEALCAPEDELLAVDCGYQPRHVIGLSPYLFDQVTGDCSLRTCQVALGTAAQQCTSNGGEFSMHEAQSGLHVGAECCDGLADDCMRLVWCH
ncbi:MAG: hypothetical protein H6741_32305 [Alphaproteobacteria bacterium]|nr:hypothetical protein [Alphaproteobacteria bacterium]